MEKLFLTQETVYNMYSLLNECESFLKDSSQNTELLNKVTNFLSEVERERDSYSYLQNS